MSKRPHITREEERALGRRVLRGDKKAREALALAHQPFVIHIATRYGGRGAAHLEMVQAGMLGLMESIDRYDPERPTRLLTLAFWTIRRRVIETIRENAQMHKCSSLDASLPSESRPVSLSQANGESDSGASTLGELLIDDRAVSPLDEAVNDESLGRAKNALRNMKTRTRQIVRMRLGMQRPPTAGASFVEIGRHFGISAERVRRIYVGAIRRLKGKVEG